FSRDEDVERNERNFLEKSMDPSPGSFLLEMDPSPGQTDFQLRHRSGVPYWTSGGWIGTHFNNMPGSEDDSVILQQYVQLSPSSKYFTYLIVPNPYVTLAREVMDENGDVLVYILIDNSKWSLVWSEPQTQCGIYGVCGAYGVCKSNETQSCSCLQGFRPADDLAWSLRKWWLSGCLRDTPLECSTRNGTTDGFLKVSGMSLSTRQTSFRYSQETTLQGCRTVCLNNYSCTTFSVTNSNPPIYSLWFGDLLSMSFTSGGQLFFIRMSASDFNQSSISKGKNRTVALSISLHAGFSVLVLMLLLFVRHRRLLKRKRDDNNMMSSLRTFTYKELKIATKKFSHELGRGAFRSVFKGTLPN
ncbi:hypothetical protein KI387_033948, partial [Taxus chinensis]